MYPVSSSRLRNQASIAMLSRPASNAVEDQVPRCVKVIPEEMPQLAAFVGKAKP
jgi:hypothetical protein